MSIWHKEVVRVDGDLKAYIGVQNDYTGQIRYSLRDIHLDGNTYYCRADGQRVFLNTERENWLRHEDEVKSALAWYKKTKF